MTKLQSIIFCILFIVSAGCYKDSDKSTIGEEIIPVPEVLINTIITGQVINSDNEILNDYTVEVNGAEYKIDDYVFYLSLQNVKKKGQTIYIKKANDVIALETFLLIENDVNHVEFLTFDDWDVNLVSNDQHTLGTDVNLGLGESSWKLNTFEYNGDIYLNGGKFNEHYQTTQIGFSAHDEILFLDVKDGFYFDVLSESNEILFSSNASIIVSFINPEFMNSGLFQLNNENGKWEFVMDIENSKSHYTTDRGGHFLIAEYYKGRFVEGKCVQGESTVSYVPMSYTIDGFDNYNHLSTLNGRWLKIIPKEVEVTISLRNYCDEEIALYTAMESNEDRQNIDIEVESEHDLFSKATEVIECDGNLADTPTILLNNKGSKRLLTINNSHTIYNFPFCEANSISGYNIKEDTNGPFYQSTIEGLPLSNCKLYQNGLAKVIIGDETEWYPKFILDDINGKYFLTSANGDLKFIFSDNDNRNYNENEINVDINAPGFGNNGYYMSCSESMVGCGLTQGSIEEVGEGDTKFLLIDLAGTLWMETVTPVVAGKYDLNASILIKLD